MKTIQVLVYDCETGNILCLNDLELPKRYVNTDVISGFDAAIDILNEIGFGCCMMSPVFINEKTEIWQALMVDADGETELPSNLQWIAEDYIDCKTDGTWRQKFFKKNLPGLIQQNMELEAEAKRKANRKSYVDEDEETASAHSEEEKEDDDV